MPAPRSRHHHQPSIWLSAALLLSSALLLSVAGCATPDSISNPAPIDTPSTTSAPPRTQARSPVSAGPTTRAPTTTAPPVTTVLPDEQPTPTAPDELAAALTEAEQMIRDASLASETRAAWGRRQQLLYRMLNANRSWVNDVLKSVDPTASEAVAANWEARLALDALLDTARVSATLPAWSIEAPAAPDDLIGFYREAEDQTGVPWEVLAAINLIETRMGRINGLSTAGALGPMQFLPTTWEECCEGDPTDGRDAILGAATYLANRGALSDLDRAIFGYNNSEHYVRAVRSYATVLAEEPEAYYGYHGWEVYFRSTEGLLSLPVGYYEPEPVDAKLWLTANPDRLVDLTLEPAE